MYAALLPPAPLPAPMMKNQWAKSTTTPRYFLPLTLVTTQQQMVCWMSHRVGKKKLGCLDILVDVAFSLNADDCRPLFLRGVGQN
jgi:hypothetical protein